MQLVISEIKESSAMALQAVKLLAQYVSGRKSKVSSRVLRQLGQVGRWSCNAGRQQTHNFISIF